LTGGPLALPLTGGPMPSACGPWNRRPDAQPGPARPGPLALTGGPARPIFRPGRSSGGPLAFSSKCALVPLQSAQPSQSKLQSALFSPFLALRICLSAKGV